MKKYKVVVDFSDFLDGCYEYKAGDEYPRLGFTPTQERIQELASENNSRNKAVIEAVVNKRGRNA